ncbi:capsular biosynthesis protein [uncultured Thiodictyon sp.]|uniref:capsule biosynthesis protein n=1 Tax=uncultured Thiodictyon sp. TaxID=1846217 RepID=UPI0026005A43|nr:capsular biosynthesis protein [uncultured Thiodictyon sp.]
MPKLHFVFLQGMPSPFFSRIGDRLSRAGCQVTGINLCFGDWFFWNGGETINYRGSLDAWPRFLDEFCAINTVTDLVLLGEQRNYHQRAVAVAQARGVRVTVTDFGYLRPDWITLERDGMGGNSRFPRSVEAIRALAMRLPAPDLTRRYSDSALRMAVGDLLYSFGNALLWWLFPRYQRSDKRPHPFIYAPASARRLLRARAGQRRAAAALQALRARTERYFVFPLQLEHDFQIVAYSPFTNLDEPIRLVIASFARHAAPDTCLLIKAHPWDPGVKNWAKRVGRWAAEVGVATRVVYIDGGNLDEMIHGSAGLVTVNSTSGIRALQLGSPVKLLGQAVYDVPGLTFQGHLDAFWSTAQPPDTGLVESFIRALTGTIQIRGVFFSEPGLTAAVTAAVERLLTQAVGEPQVV